MDHPIERIHDKENVDLFPQNVSFAVNCLRMQLLFPAKELVDSWLMHEKDFYEDRSSLGKWNGSSTQLTFLCRAVEANCNFEEATNLAVFVSECVKDGP